MSYFQTLLTRDGTNIKDVERKAMFWILGNNEDLFKKIDHIYDFQERAIKIECLEGNSIDLCSSSVNLIKLAFNLYNGYPCDVRGAFCVLDSDNFKIALEAIEIRFPH